MKKACIVLGSLAWITAAGVLAQQPTLRSNIQEYQIPLSDVLPLIGLDNAAAGKRTSYRIEGQSLIIIIEAPVVP